MKCDLTLKPRGNIWKARELSHHSLVITVNSLTILPAVFSLWFSQCLNSTAFKKKKKKIKLTETSSDLLSLVHFHLLSQYHPGTLKKTEPSLISSLPHPEPTHIFSYLCLPLTIPFSERGLPPIHPKLICKYSRQLQNLHNPETNPLSLSLSFCLPHRSLAQSIHSSFFPTLKHFSTK